MYLKLIQRIYLSIQKIVSSGKPYLSVYSVYMIGIHLKLKQPKLQDDKTEEFR
jgi:hypothetical protein